MAGRMKTDPAFLAEQRAGVDGPRVRVINQLVRELRDARPGVSVPMIPPHYDAGHASILMLASDPGPMAGGQRGSGFLSHENGDPSATRMQEIAVAVALSDDDCLPWNAYPWYLDDQSTKLRAAHINDGVAVLKVVLDRHPRIRSVIALGQNAHWVMQKFTKAYPEFLEERSIEVWKVRHTGNLAWTMPVPAKARAMAAMLASYREAMGHAGLAFTAGDAAEAAALTTVDPVLVEVRAAILAQVSGGDGVEGAVRRHVAGLSESRARPLLEALLLRDLATEAVGVVGPTARERAERRNVLREMTALAQDAGMEAEPPPTLKRLSEFEDGLDEAFEHGYLEKLRSEWPD